jgi:Cys-tRNA(Pro) deacylase
MSDAVPLHPSAHAVVEAAQRQGVDLVVREFPAGTRTAADAAAAIGVEVAQIVKSLVFRVDDRVVVALVSGVNRVEERRLAESAGGSNVRRADAETVRAPTGYPIGGVPPFGHHTVLPTFIDHDLLQYDEVWAAAGTPHRVFPISPADLVRLTGAVPAALGG